MNKHIFRTTSQVYYYPPIMLNNDYVKTFLQNNEKGEEVNTTAHLHQKKKKLIQLYRRYEYIILAKNK